MDGRKSSTHPIPSYILSHPIFHDGVTETEATAILLASNGNYLLCPSLEPNQIILMYKAFVCLKNHFEVASFSLKIDHNDKMLSPVLELLVPTLLPLLRIPQLGTFPVTRVASQLTYYFKTHKREFTPLPVFSKKFFIEDVHINDAALPPLPNDMIKGSLIPLCDAKTMISARYISKAWCSFVNKSLLMKKLDEEAVAKQKKNIEKMNYLADRLIEHLSPERNYQTVNYEKLVLADYSLSDCRNLSNVGVSCIEFTFSKMKLDSSAKERLVRIGYDGEEFNEEFKGTQINKGAYYISNLEVLNMVQVTINNIGSEHIKILINGKKATDSFVNFLVMMCRFGGYSSERSISNLEKHFLLKQDIIRAELAAKTLTLSQPKK